MNKNINDEIKELIKVNEVCLFMKGTPEIPQCGFSMAVSNVLKHLKVNFIGINVLEKNEIRCLNPSEMWFGQEKESKILVIGRQYLNYILKVNL